MNATCIASRKIPASSQAYGQIPPRTFTIVCGDVWVSKVGEERPNERIGRLVAVCGSPEDADRAARRIDAEWRAGRRKSTEFALRYRVTLKGAGTYRTSEDGDVEKILVVDPLIEGPKE